MDKLLGFFINIAFWCCVFIKIIAEVVISPFKKLFWLFNDDYFTKFVLARYIVNNQGLCEHKSKVFELGWLTSPRLAIKMIKRYENADKFIFISISRLPYTDVATHISWNTLLQTKDIYL